MAHTIQFDEKTGILIVTHTGRVTLEGRLKLLEEIKALLPAEGEVKFLSDLSQAEIDMTSDEPIQYGEIIAREPRSRQARIATVYSSDDPLKYLSESTLHLKGDNVKVASFTSKDEAYRWLTAV
jgi:hypothetical protein